MMKRLTVAVGVVMAMAFSAPAFAAFKVDVDQVYNVFGDSRLEGTGRHFGLAFDVADDMDLGFYFERTGVQFTGDVGATPPTTTQLNVDMQAIRLMRRLGNIVSVGVDLGNVKIQQGANTTGALAALNQTKPFAGLVAGLRYGKEIKDNMGADMHLNVGYRFLNLNDVATGVANESTISDLNALTVAFGVGFHF